MFSFRAATVQTSYCLRVSMRHAFTTLTILCWTASRPAVGRHGRRGRLRTTWPYLLLTYTKYDLAILAVDVHLLADRARKPAFAYFHVRSLGRWLVLGSVNGDSVPACVSAPSRG